MVRDGESLLVHTQVGHQTLMGTNHVAMGLGPVLDGRLQAQLCRKCRSHVTFGSSSAKVQNLTMRHLPKSLEANHTSISGYFAEWRMRIKKLSRQETPNSGWGEKEARLVVVMMMTMTHR